MKHSLFWLLLLWLLPVPLFAEEIKSFEAETVVEIVDRDNAYARTRAFGEIRHKLVEAAVEELVGSEIFAEYQSLFLGQRKLDPVTYIGAVKVLQEESKDNQFYMRIQGQIRMDGLADKLKSMGFPLALDSPVKVALLIEEHLQIPQKELLERLKLFRIEVEQTEVLSLGSELPEDRQSSAFAEQIFERTPKANIVFLVETSYNNSADSADGVAVRIYRKVDQSQISFFFMRFKPLPPEQVGAFLKANVKPFLALFSIKTLQTSSYDSGGKALVRLNIKGLSDPRSRALFEEQVLKRNRLVKSFFRTHWSLEETSYQIESSTTQARLILALLKKQSRFDFEVLKEEANQYWIQAIVEDSPEILPLREFVADEILLRDISLVLGLSEAGDEVQVSEEYVPALAERERNNSLMKVNPLPVGALVYGKISSRADDDLFAIDVAEESDGITLEWTKLNATKLRPQLRIYDEKFNFLQSYGIARGSEQIQVKYNFPSERPKRLYIRLSDRTGRISGEAGAPLLFRYMIRYWNI